MKILVGGVSIQYTGLGRFIKACHIAKVGVRSLLVQTVTSITGPKHFQMSANRLDCGKGDELSSTM